MKWILGGISCFLIFFLLSLPARKMFLDKSLPDYYSYKQSVFWPLEELKSYSTKIYDYFKDPAGLKFTSYIAGLKCPENDETFCHLSKDDELHLVLHIGESIRSDKLSLNGYEKETTPLLNERKNNIVSFPHCYAYAPFTRLAIFGILTDAEVESRSPRYGTFFKLLEKHNFATHSIYSIDKKYIFESPIVKLFKNCSKENMIASSLYYCDNQRNDSNDVQHVFIPTVNAFKEFKESSPSLQKTFYIINDLGAHFYFRSYNNNKKFLPDTFDPDKPLENMTNLHNAYDNNLIEIDWEVNEIISKLEDKIAIYFFISDHGLYLGENSLFGNANPVDVKSPILKPACFIWMSDSFKNKYPDIVRALKSNKNKIVSQDYVYHTILSFSKITAPVYKESLDLTNPNCQEFTPPQQPLIFLKDF